MSLTIYWSETSEWRNPYGGDTEELTIGQLDLDIVETDSYDMTSSVTAHAMESGIPVTDHIRPEQDRASCTVNISGRQHTTTFVEGVTHGTVELEGGGEVVGIVVPEDTDRLGSCLAALKRLQRGGFEVDVDGLQMPIEGWAIERVSAPRTMETAGLLVCDIAFVELRFAEVEEVDAPSPRVERGRPQQDQGRAGSRNGGNEEVSNSPAERAESESVLRAAGRGIAAAIGSF
ncbi:hypothetical protein KKD03_05670 [Patescibacteria group bacterium]|nr:hypothetical protein [Patescibacteria group bacterium]